MPITSPRWRRAAKLSRGRSSPTPARRRRSRSTPRRSRGAPRSARSSASSGRASGLRVPAGAAAERREDLRAAGKARGDIAGGELEAADARAEVERRAGEIGCAELAPAAGGAGDRRVGSRLTVGVVGPADRNDVVVHLAVDERDVIVGGAETGAAGEVGGGVGAGGNVAGGGTWTGAVGELAAEEDEALVGGADRARLDDIAARGGAGGVADRADLAVLEQRYAVVAPDEVDIAGDERIEEPRIALELNRILLAQERRILGHQATCVVVEVERLGLARGGARSQHGIAKGERVEREQVGGLDQEHGAAAARATRADRLTAARAAVERLVVAILDDHAVAALADNGDVVLAAQEQQLGIRAVLDIDRHRRIAR